MNVRFTESTGSAFFSSFFFRPYLKVSTDSAFLGLPGTDSHSKFPIQTDFHSADCMWAKTLKI